uniref:Uncharacterized protein n=1 Tax=Arundo donax TaxID=35708 RepID=A0A0A9CGI9_ARUDO
MMERGAGTTAMLMGSGFQM